VNLETRMVKKPKITNGQRALWSFLIATLAGPFFAALIVALLTLASGALQMGPPSLKGLPIADVGAKAGAWALQSFVWAALPAGLAGAAIAAWVSLKGTVPWIGAVVAGVVAFGIGSITIPGLIPNHGTPLAFIAALSSLGVWLILSRARIIAPS
jgi:hypothetical protein